MIKKYLLTVICLFLVSNLVTGCKPSGTAQNKPAGYFKTDFQDESQFIVETIVADLAEQIYYAKFHRLPDTRCFQAWIQVASATSLAGEISSIKHF